VHVRPSGVDVEVGEDQSIMAAAESQGLFWPTICHGQAECHACFFQVVEGEEHLEAPSEFEQEALSRFVGGGWFADRPVRLACQARVKGDVTIHKPGVRAVRTVESGSL
jgi:2Fe-2S ferredoxin